ncbi:MAG: hypothetical protein ACLSGF_00460 [Alistipes onderdonkii]
MKNGTNAPEVGIDLFEGVYYWTIGGKGNWLSRCGREQNPCRRQGRLETPNGRRCRRPAGLWTGCVLKMPQATIVKSCEEQRKRRGLVLRIGDGRRR